MLIYIAITIRNVAFQPEFGCNVSQLVPLSFKERAPVKLECSCDTGR